ncbi:MAG: hypothetical protein GYA62_10495 [Bacteroidales bacterium]|nr:hypothetical protein [Bacteroidales bacterium]
MRLSILLLIGLTVFACNQTTTNESKEEINEIVANSDPWANYSDTLKVLLDKSISNDTIEIECFKHFLFFKSGHLFDRNQKHALSVTCPTDSTYKVEMYILEKGAWTLMDTLKSLDAFPIQFATTLKDFNFDRQTDLYIQVTISNGWPLSRGHLIIIYPKTKKFQLHPETREFANMEPDSISKTVFSEVWDGYDNKSGEQNLILLTNKWINNKLVTVGKEKVTVDLNEKRAAHNTGLTARWLTFSLTNPLGFLSATVKP